MRRLVPCLVVTLLVLTACDKKKTTPTESTVGQGPVPASVERSVQRAV